MEQEQQSLGLPARWRAWRGPAITVAASAGACLLFWASLGARLEDQAERNLFLEREIGKLARETDELSAFDRALTEYLAWRKAYVEAVAGSGYAAEAIADLSRLPAGTVLRSLVLKDGKFVARGETALRAGDPQLQAVVRDWLWLRNASLQWEDPSDDRARRAFRIDGAVVQIGQGGTR